MSTTEAAWEMNPGFTSGAIGATTTMWAQQHRHPSPEHPWSESLDVWVEKKQVGGEIKSQAKISVAAKSNTKTVIMRRAAGQNVIKYVRFHSAIHGGKLFEGLNTRGASRYAGRNLMRTGEVIEEAARLTLLAL